MKSSDWQLGLIVGFMMGATFVCLLYICLRSKPAFTYEHAAVAAGHAHYAALTGEFEWNEPCGPRPELRK